MATPTYTALATTTLGASASSVTFSSIPATYRDLIIVITGTQSAANAKYYVNGETATTNYSAVLMSGEATTFTDSYTSDRRVWYANTTQNSSIIQFMDYSATDKHKTVLSRSNEVNNVVYAFAARWASTAAINSITLDGTTFDAGNTISLYGIAS